MSSMKFRGSLLLSLCLLVAAGASLPVRAESLSEVFQRVYLSVVVIETTQKDISTFGPTTPVTIGGVGSGVLISNDGKVMTAAHVVQTAESIRVVFQSGEKIPARVLTSQPPADVALLQLERMPAVARIARIGDSDASRVGDQVFVVGAPFGISHTLTVGHISARRKPDAMLGGLGLAEFFQTDAAINQGNSGGPMFNADGEVIGIVSHIVTVSGGFEGLGFAVTSNMARRLLLEQEPFWTGLEGFLLRDDLAKVFNVPQEAGVLVQRVAAGSPAEHIGIRAGTAPARIGDQELLVGGDILLAVQGVPITGDENDYVNIRASVLKLKEGDKMMIKVLRGGEVLELEKFFFPDLVRPKPLVGR
jgi:S1-C subfamily serine protease